MEIELLLTWKTISNAWKRVRVARVAFGAAVVTAGAPVVAAAVPTGGALWLAGVQLGRSTPDLAGIDPGPVAAEQTTVALRAGAAAGLAPVADALAVSRRAVGVVVSTVPARNRAAHPAPVLTGPRVAWAAGAHGHRTATQAGAVTGARAAFAAVVGARSVAAASVGYGARAQGPAAAGSRSCLSTVVAARLGHTALAVQNAGAATRCVASPTLAG